MLPRKFHEKFSWNFHENSLIKNDFSRNFHEKYCESFMKSLHENIMNSYMKVSWTVSRNFLEKWVFWGDFSWIFLENFSWKFYDIIYMILSKNIATKFLLCKRIATKPWINFFKYTYFYCRDRVLRKTYVPVRFPRF